MTTDASIFDLRFGSNEDLVPTPAELKAFLGSPKKEGRREKHEQDLAAYSALLEQVASFELHERVGAARGAPAERMYYGALSHTRFFNTGLKSAVEQFKFHLQAMRSLDFKKPEAFIRAAEEEMAGLNPKKKHDAEKLARLEGMVAERKALLETLKRQRGKLERELRNIAAYIRDNLGKIAAVSEAAVAVLADSKVVGSEKRRVIEDIKTQFKEELRSALHEGKIKKEDLETAKHDVDRLSAEISAVLRDDISALRSIYETVRGVTLQAVNDIDAVLAEQRNAAIEDERSRLSRIEQTLVLLVRDHDFDLPQREVRSETRHQNLLVEKREEMIENLFDLLHKERRKRFDRRTGEDRRRRAAADAGGPKRRSGRDRRNSGKRRK